MNRNRQRSRHAVMAVTGALHAGGGIAALNRLVMRYLADEDYTIELFALTEQDASIDSRYVPADRIQYRVYKGDKIRFASGVWRALLPRRHALVISDHVNVAALLAPWDAMGALQYLVWLCGVEVFPPRPDFEGNLGLRAATRRVAISDYTRSVVARRYSSLSIDLCELALDPVRHAYSLPSELPPPLDGIIELEAITGEKRLLGDRVLLHVGRMAATEQYKGQDVLLEAFSSLVRQWPQIELVLVGDGDDRQRLLEIAKRAPHETQSRIYFAGMVSDSLLHALYRTAYLFAMPSSGEGFGLVYLEAMSRGLPCLGGKLDATLTVVQDGVTGLLVDDPHSTAQVAAAIDTLLRTPGLARQMGEAGYGLVRSKFLYPHFRARFHQILNQ